MAASVVAFPVAVGYAAFSNSTSTTYISMFAAIFSAFTNIAANFILIPRYGMIGCAWATVIAYFVSVSVFATLLKRAVKMPFSWTVWAILPIALSALTLTFGQNPFWAFGVCLAGSFLVAYFFKGSVEQSFLFLKKFGNQT
jgi:Na+-driven multidrug efflux pump